MPKSARLDLRVDPELKARVEALAAERGQTLTVFVERALQAALGDRPAAGQPASVRKVAGSTPVAPARPTAPAFNRVTTLKR